MTKSFNIIFFFLFFFVSCDSIVNKENQEIQLDKNKILKDFKSKFSAAIPDDSLVSISSLKDSPIKGLKEGVILFKTLEETQQLSFFISNDGRYIIFQPQIYDFSGPIRNPALMDTINTKRVPKSNNSKNSIRIIEYSDFQCPACKYGAQQVEKLKNEYGDKITFYYKHYPLTFHKWADDAAFFTSCINDLYGSNNFWIAHDLIFKNQENITEGTFYESIRDIFSSVDFNYNTCLNEDVPNKYKEFIEASIKEGTEIGVKSTPTFIVEGYIIPGADYNKIKEAIDTFIQN